MWTTVITVWLGFNVWLVFMLWLRSEGIAKQQEESAANRADAEAGTKPR